ncbi:hypothetical protein AALP_AA8G165400 [Arabis alpina]|uniref:Uncharacterized protein n=1 Tax=Arabis alpina TaxID=50452 RepID=A0A087G7G5_ARAAL|nr:hypothetical protein AALP_AA8G165400 [Arabis alpina]
MQAPTTSLESSIEPRPDVAIPTRRPDVPDGRGADVLVGLGGLVLMERRARDGGPKTLGSPMFPKTRGVSLPSDPTLLQTQDGPRTEEVMIDGMIPLNDEDPELPHGCADVSSSSSSSDSRNYGVEGDGEDIVDEVEQPKKAASTQRVKVRPDPPGSTLSKKESLQRFREK